MRAGDLMTTPVLSIGPQTSLRAAARIMVRERIGSLCVVDADDTLLGLITEADLLPLALHQDPTRHVGPVRRDVRGRREHSRRGDDYRRGRRSLGTPTSPTPPGSCWNST